MKRLMILATVFITLTTSAGWFGIITKGDVKDAFLRTSFYHSGVGDLDPDSVVVESTKTKNVFRITWQCVYTVTEEWVPSHYENGKWIAGRYKKLRSPKKEYNKNSGLFHARKSEKYACSIRQISTVTDY